MRIFDGCSVIYRVDQSCKYEHDVLFLSYLKLGRAVKCVLVDDLLSSELSSLINLWQRTLNFIAACHWSDANVGCAMFQETLRSGHARLISWNIVIFKKVPDLVVWKGFCFTSIQTVLQKGGK